MLLITSVCTVNKGKIKFNMLYNIRVSEFGNIKFAYFESVK